MPALGSTIAARAGAGTIIQNANKPTLYKSGCSFGSFDQYHMYMNPGAIAGGDGTIIAIPTTLELNILVNKLVDGGSVGIPGSSTCIGGVLDYPAVSGKHYHLYLVQKDTDPTRLAVVASQAIDASSVIAQLIGTGFHYFRPLMCCFTYHTGRGANWQGIPDFFNLADEVEFLLSGAGMDANYCVLNAGAATAFTDVDLSPWLADSAREVCLVGVSSGGAAGFVRPRSITSGGFLISAGGEVWVKTDGSRFIQYKVASGTLSLYIKAYKFCEPR